MKRYIKIVYRLIITFVNNPYIFFRILNTVPSICKAKNFAQGYNEKERDYEPSVSYSENPIRNYFENHKAGRGIWKWEHYFDIYHRHFSRFIGEKVHVLEIGVYSGGSLDMWKSYFGENCKIFGVDIEENCQSYEGDDISIYIGDQSDRSFWKNFKKSVNGIDILIDDGSHKPDHQLITLEEMLPFLNPGGVYLCEDVQGSYHRFSAFASGLVDNLNDMNRKSESLLQSNVSRFQSSIYSIHFYAFVIVIEKHLAPPTIFTAPKHGTQWNPKIPSKTEITLKNE